jgi:hypothetical protein
MRSLSGAIFYNGDGCVVECAAKRWVCRHWYSNEVTVCWKAKSTVPGLAGDDPGFSYRGFLYLCKYYGTRTVQVNLSLVEGVGWLD